MYSFDISLVLRKSLLFCQMMDESLIFEARNELSDKWLLFKGRTQHFLNFFKNKLKEIFENQCVNKVTVNVGIKGVVKTQK